MLVIQVPVTPIQFTAKKNCCVVSGHKLQLTLSNDKWRIEEEVAHQLC